MPSNEKMIEDINELAKGLDLKIETKGKPSRELVALLSDLRGKTKDAESITDADKAEADKEKAKASAAKLAKAEAAAEAKKAKDGKAAVKKGGYIVAPGKSMCCTKRGIISEGEEVKASDLGGGADALARLIEKEVVTKA